MRAIGAVAFGSLVLANCASYDTVSRIRDTTFQRGKNPGSFTFVGQADAITPHDTPEGEAGHQAVLKEWLRVNAMCQSGYEITSRRVAVQTVGLFGIVAKITYEGHCQA